MMERIENRAGSRQATVVFLRRHVWLIILGLLHAYFVWNGDFIFPYGLCALLLLYSCLRLSTRLLLALGCILILVPGTYGLLVYSHTINDATLAGRVALARIDMHAG